MLWSATISSYTHPHLHPPELHSSSSSSSSSSCSLSFSSSPLPWTIKLLRLSGVSFPDDSSLSPSSPSPSSDLEVSSLLSMSDPDGSSLSPSEVMSMSPSFQASTPFGRPTLSSMPSICSTACSASPAAASTSSIRPSRPAARACSVAASTRASVSCASASSGAPSAKRRATPSAAFALIIASTSACLRASSASNLVEGALGNQARLLSLRRVSTVALRAFSTAASALFRLGLTMAVVEESSCDSAGASAAPAFDAAGLPELSCLRCVIGTSSSESELASAAFPCAVSGSLCARTCTWVGVRC
mmetsp:Transcript_76333/g.151276  ORF Transcript_76333/g.151276 Transcript_76333/m.151276 type:complete len:303 (+) Transcript_76333:631-1539(+)